MKNRYLVFNILKYDSAGGMGDLAYTSPVLEEALRYIAKAINSPKCDYDFYQVYDVIDNVILGVRIEAYHGLDYIGCYTALCKKESEWRPVRINSPEKQHVSIGITYIILSDDGFWNNDTGWCTSVEAANTLTGDEILSFGFMLPHGKNVRWVDASKWLK